MDLGMSELLVIGVVALIVIGPKDLPQLFRTLGRFTAKMRAMAREFTSAMEAAADETGVKDVANDLRAVTSPQSMGLDKVTEAMDRFEKWDPIKGAKPSGNPTLSAAPKVATGPTLAQATTKTTVADAKPRGPMTADLAAKPPEPVAQPAPAPVATTPAAPATPPEPDA